MSQEDEIQEVVEANSIDRLVPLERVCNFRSVGGLVTTDGTKVVRHGLLFRSSHFDDATKADFSKLMEPSNNKMYVKTIVDLRDKDEAADKQKLVRQMYQKKGCLPCRSEKTAESKKDDYLWVNIPILTREYKMNVVQKTPQKHKLVGKALKDKLFGTDAAPKHVVATLLNKQGLRGLYQDMLLHSKKNFLNVLKLISDAKDHGDAPIVVHCEHGKDRTGLVIMLVYACLGVSEDDIVADYALSYEGLVRMRARMRKEMVEELGMVEELIDSPASVMHDTRSFLKEKLGGIISYLTAIGFDDNWQQKLREQFLVDRSPKS